MKAVICAYQQSLKTWQIIQLSTVGDGGEIDHYGCEQQVMPST